MLLNPWNPAARLSFAGLVACLMVLGACTTETLTEVEVGKQVTMNLDGAVKAEAEFDHRYVYVVVHGITNGITQEITREISQDAVQAEVRGAVEGAVQEFLRFHYRFRYQEVSDLLTAQPGVEDVEVSVSVGQEKEGEVNIDILAFGSDLDGEDLVGAITRSYPDLSPAAVEITDLHVTISESLASRIGRTLFRMEGKRPNPVELRQQALRDFAARG